MLTKYGLLVRKAMSYFWVARAGSPPSIHGAPAAHQCGCNCCTCGAPVAWTDSLCDPFINPAPNSVRPTKVSSQQFRPTRFRQTLSASVPWVAVLWPAMCFLHRLMQHLSTHHPDPQCSMRHSIDINGNLKKHNLRNHWYKKWKNYW